MKTIKFFAYWALDAALFYAWLVLGYGGAFNVLAAWMIAVGLVRLMGLYIPGETLRKGFNTNALTRKLAFIFSVGNGVAMIWFDHVWLGVFYLGAWAMWKLRLQIAREASAKNEAA
jgi:hypothetical protein